MSRGQALRVRDTALAIGVATASALAMGLLLASASSPPDFKVRLEALQSQTRQTQDLMRPLPAGSLYPTDAICRGDANAAAKGLRDGLSAFAAQASLSLDALDARPESAEAARLTPVRLRFSATGSYESVVMLLAALSRQRPDVFADEAVLTSKTSNVTLSFSGRAFCSA